MFYFLFYFFTFRFRPTGPPTRPGIARSILGTPRRSNISYEIFRFPPRSRRFLKFFFCFSSVSLGFPHLHVRFFSFPPPPPVSCSFVNVPSSGPSRLHNLVLDINRNDFRVKRVIVGLSHTSACVRARRYAAFLRVCTSLRCARECSTSICRRRRLVCGRRAI